jgi:hypothetical protein
MTTNIDTIVLPLPIWVPSTDGVGGLFEVADGRNGRPVAAIIAMAPWDEDQEPETQKLFVEFGTGEHYTATELGEAYGDIAWKADIGPAGDVDNQYAPYKTENQRIAEYALIEAKDQLRMAERFLASAQHEGAVNKGNRDKTTAELAIAQAEWFIAQVDALTEEFMEHRY